jgi:hypothetical protein
LRARKLPDDDSYPALYYLLSPLASDKAGRVHFSPRGTRRGEAFLDNACDFRLKTQRNNPDHSGVDAKCLARPDANAAPNIVIHSDGRGICGFSGWSG